MVRHLIVIDGRGLEVTVETAKFDDTELSQASDWQEAQQRGPERPKVS